MVQHTATSGVGKHLRALTITLRINMQRILHGIRRRRYRCLQGIQAQLINAHRPRQRMFFHFRNRLGTPQHNARLRAAKQLIATSNHHIGPCNQLAMNIWLLRQRGIMREQARTQVHKQVLAVGARKLAQLVDAHRSRESFHTDIRRVHF